MPTTYNQFDFPASTDAPDGPGGIFTLADEVDKRVGIGGAEYQPNLAGITSIPAARTFYGKLALAADTSYIYRYCGATDGWVLWDMGRTWQAYTYASGFTNSSSNSISLRWTIRSGVLMVQGIVYGTFTTGAPSTVTTNANVPPAVYRPAASMVGLAFAATAQSAKPAYGQLANDGTISVGWNNLGTATTAPAYISLAASFPYGQNL